MRRDLPEEESQHGPGVLPRKLLEQMMLRFPKKVVEKDKELSAPADCDLRSESNTWLRLSFRDSGLLRVPRETQMRLAIKALLRKTRSCIFDGMRACSHASFKKFMS